LIIGKAITMFLLLFRSKLELEQRKDKDKKASYVHIERAERRKMRHCEVPYLHKEGGSNLGIWLN
jgi:hypothetical protein